MKQIFAHTLSGVSTDKWEPLYGSNSHAERTAAVMASFRVPFSERVCNPSYAKKLLHLLAVSHDMGKASEAFQRYLRNGGGAKVDHKTAAAKWWIENGSVLGHMMSYVCFGHHGGLCSGTPMFEQIQNTPFLSEVRKHLPEELQHAVEKKPFQVGMGCTTKEECYFSLMLALRMFHSCLIDADWLATEAFCDADTNKRRAAREYKSMAVLSQTLEDYIAEREQPVHGKINELRKLVHHSCYNAASQTPNVYRLNVPTGGGKSLSSLSFALRHAELNNLQRVIYVIPYTSIIDQTAREFRAIFGDEQVIEHHSNITEEVDSEDNRLATENWDAPIIITTSVQFFETLFSCKNSRCRKIHNIANAVIVFDEVQTLPTNLLKPCLLALKTLQREYNCTHVLCTATQPALTNRDRFDIGWPENEVKSLLGHELEESLAKEMKRVKVEFLGSITEESLVSHFISLEMGSALIIVNLTSQAQKLYELLKARSVSGLFHLSARMCPAHRMDVLNEVRERLLAGLPTVLVATRVVEAGVDISFPVVYRDQCGLDSLAQAAGRCNRHGELSEGKVYSFVGCEYDLPGSFVDLRDGIYALQDTLSLNAYEDVFEPRIVHDYFVRFYEKRRHGSRDWDNADICALINTQPKIWDFPEIAQKFCFIKQEQRQIVVPYGKDVEKMRQSLMALNLAGIMPSRSMFRKLQAYTVSLYAEEWNRVKNNCECVHEKANIWMLVDAPYYDSERGLLKDINQPLNYIF